MVKLLLLSKDTRQSYIVTSLSCELETARTVLWTAHSGQCQGRENENNGYCDIILVSVFRL